MFKMLNGYTSYGQPFKNTKNSIAKPDKDKDFTE